MLTADACGKQSSERGRQAAPWCGQEQFHGEVHEKCLVRLAAVRQTRLPPHFCYSKTLRGRSSLGASLALRSFSLKVNWVRGLNGMNWDVLDGRISSTNRAFASAASIATTFWIRTAEQQYAYGRPVPPKSCDRQHNIYALLLASSLTGHHPAAARSRTSTTARRGE